MRPALTLFSSAPLRRLIAALALAGVSLAPAAAESTQASASGPCASAPYRDFDFWLGNWDVTDAKGQPAGTNVITAEEYGCLLVERWTSANGTTGQSYNFYDPGTGKWRQLWVSGGNIIDYAGGLDAAGVMRLEGQITYRAAPASAGPIPFRGSWTPNPDGTVTQAFHQYNAETKKWDEWFVGTYRRK